MTPGSPVAGSSPAPQPADGPRAIPTVFLGSGTFAVPVLESLVGTAAVRLAGVVTSPARPVGRGGTIRPSPVATRAGELGTGPILTPGRLADPAAVADIRALGPELIVLADYGQLVPAIVLELPGHGALNLHPSLLPRHRGAIPVQAAILAGDRETGVTLMVMDAGLDTGPIVAQVAVPLDGTELAPELEARLAREAGALLAAVLPGWLAGVHRAHPQPPSAEPATRSLRREDGRLVPARGATMLERQVRAYQPWPGSFVDTTAGRLVVWRARPLGIDVGRDGRATEGTFVPDGDGFALAVRDGALRLDEVQLAGGRRMTTGALLRGHPGIVGSHVLEPAPR